MERGFFMGLQYKVDVIELLRGKGITTYTLRRNKLLSESTIQKLRDGGKISWDNIESICMLLECQPNDFLEFVPKEKDSHQE